MEMVHLTAEEMSDKQLDYAAATLQGWELVGGNWVKGGDIMCGPASEYRPSKDWRQLGSLIEYIHKKFSTFYSSSDELLTECIVIMNNDAYDADIAVPAYNEDEKDD